MPGILTRSGLQVRIEPVDDGKIPYPTAKPTHGKHLPTDPKERKRIPLWSGLFKYFPDALVAVAHVSQVGNDQHNPGEPLHWARGKSMDQEDTLLRHLLESGEIDSDGIRHSAKLAWRALALLQLELEKAKGADDNKANDTTYVVSGHSKSYPQPE